MTVTGRSDMVLRLLIVAGLWAFPMVAVAQTTTGAVHVLARDEANAVLPGVRIVLDGPVLQQSATDGEGVAVFDRVPAGTYELVATLAGWINQRVSITVSPGSTTSQQLTLRLGAATVTGYSKPVRDRIVTFLTNGPQLEPLGAGEFARSWRSRPIADLFEALAKLQR